MKKKVGGGGSWNQKVKDVLETPVWVCGEKIQGMGSICVGKPQWWKQSCDMEMSIQTGPEWAVTNSWTVISILVGSKFHYMMKYVIVFVFLW